MTGAGDELNRPAAKEDQVTEVMSCGRVYSSCTKSDLSKDKLPRQAGSSQAGLQTKRPLRCQAHSPSQWCTVHFRSGAFVVQYRQSAVGALLVIANSLKNACCQRTAAKAVGYSANGCCSACSINSNGFKRLYVCYCAAKAARDRVRPATLCALSCMLLSKHCACGVVGSVSSKY